MIGGTHAMHSAPLPVRRAIDGLVGHGVLGFTPGSGAAPSTFHMTLPKRTIAAMSTAVAEDAPAPPF